jgi:biotin carboxyl carrier protein
MEKKLKITVDGRQYSVLVEDLSDGEGLIFPGPGSMSVPQPPASPPPVAPAAQAMPAAGPGDEVSPLGGVIVSIDVTVGQQVGTGDKIAAIEAMKMKTQLLANRAGKVTHIAVEVGDAVDAGQTLLTIG